MGFLVEDGVSGAAGNDALDVHSLHGGAGDGQLIGIILFRNLLIQLEGDQGLFVCRSDAVEIKHLFSDHAAGLGGFIDIQRNQPDAFLSFGNGHLELEAAGFRVGDGFEPLRHRISDALHQDAEDLRAGKRNAFHGEGSGVGFPGRRDGNIQLCGSGILRIRGSVFRAGFFRISGGGFSRTFAAGNGRLPFLAGFRQGFDHAVELVGVGVGGELIVDLQVEHESVTLADGAGHVSAVITGGEGALVLQEEVVVGVCVVLLLVHGLESVAKGRPVVVVFVGSDVFLPAFLVPGGLHQIRVLRGGGILQDADFQAGVLRLGSVPGFRVNGAPGLQHDAAGLPVGQRVFL